LLRDQQLVAFIATSDDAEARCFYEDVPAFFVEDTFFASLRGARHQAAASRSSPPPPPAYRARLVAKGHLGRVEACAAGGCVERFEAWSGRSRRLASPGGAKSPGSKDPDGNLLSLTQSERAARSWRNA